MPWDDGEGMFKGGARFSGFRIIYSFPILVFIPIPLVISMFAIPLILNIANSSGVDAFN